MKTTLAVEIPSPCTIHAYIFVRFNDDKERRWCVTIEVYEWNTEDLHSFFTEECSSPQKLNDYIENNWIVDEYHFENKLVEEKWCKELDIYLLTDPKLPVKVVKGEPGITNCKFLN